MVFMYFNGTERVENIFESNIWSQLLQGSPGENMWISLWSFFIII